MWIVERPDGSQTLLANEPDEVADAPFERYEEVDRAPAIDGTETWNFDIHEWQMDEDRALAWADWQYVLANGPSAIAISHAVKVIEARLFKMGTNVAGLLAAEANATGQLLDSLADTVIAQAEVETTAEVDRIIAKQDIRAAS